MPCAMAGLQDMSRQTTKFSWLLRTTDHRVSEKPGARDMNEVSQRDEVAPPRSLLVVQLWLMVQLWQALVQ